MYTNSSDSEIFDGDEADDIEAIGGNGDEIGLSIHGSSHGDTIGSMSSNLRQITRLSSERNFTTGNESGRTTAGSMIALAGTGESRTTRRAVPQGRTFMSSCSRMRADVNTATLDAHWLYAPHAMAVSY